MSLPSLCGPIAMDIGLIGVVRTLLFAVHLSETKSKIGWLFFLSAAYVSIIIIIFGCCLAFSLPYPELLLKVISPGALLLTLVMIISVISFPATGKNTKEEKQFKLMLFWLVSFFFGFFLMSCYFAPHM